jgi:hypothetical protein
MTEIYYWVGFVLFWLLVISGFIGSLFLLMSYIIKRSKDSWLFFQYLNNRKEIRQWEKQRDRIKKWK